MLFTEFNMEDALEVRGEEKFAEGIAASILELLEELGPVPSEMKAAILNQRNPDILKRWLKLAAKVKDLTEFKAHI